MNLETFTVDIPTLVLLIFGLVEFAKQLGAAGKGLRLLSLFLGLSLAAIFRFRDLYPHLVTWIDLLFFGLAAGLVASGVYNFLDNRFPKSYL